MYKTTKIQQTKQHHEVDLSILRAMCFHSARLYNVGLYTVRQHYFNTNTYLPFYNILLSIISCAEGILRASLTLWLISSNFILS